MNDLNDDLITFKTSLAGTLSLPSDFSFHVSRLLFRTSTNQFGRFVDQERFEARQAFTLRLFGVSGKFLLCLDHLAPWLLVRRR